MRLNAGASSGLRSLLAGPARSATLLGTARSALYLRTAGEPGAVALLAHDAVRLPCALLLPTTAAELPLTAVGPPVGGALLGDGCLTFAGPAGPVVVCAVREWAPARVHRAADRAASFAALLDALPAPDALGIDGAMLRQLTTSPAAAVAALLGRGPGLTPTGDDVLAGYLLGARAWGLDAADARAAVAAMAPDRTAALSAALLWHAVRGECVDEVAAVIADPSGPALSALLRVGHTSGMALATGLVTAALAAA